MHSVFGNLSNQCNVSVGCLASSANGRSNLRFMLHVYKLEAYLSAGRAVDSLNCE